MHAVSPPPPRRAGPPGQLLCGAQNAATVHHNRRALPPLPQVGAPGMTPVQCYLDIQGIVALAKEQGVDVIHPG